MLLVVLILIYFLPGLVVWFGRKWNSWLVAVLVNLITSIVVSTFCSFWLLYIGFVSYLYLFVILVLVSLLLRVVLRNLEFEEKFNFVKVDILSVIIIGVFILSVAFLYSPIIRPIRFEGYNFYQMPQIGDLYKHLYTITTIKEHGLMPVHPYLSSVPMYYYFGYYLLPALLCQLTNVAVTLSFYIHLLITTSIFGLLVYCLSTSFVNRYARLLFTWFCTFAFGLDVVGTYVTSRILDQPFYDHIEAWGWKLGSKLQISSPYVSAIWVPQHLFATVLLFCLIYVLLKFNNSLVKYFVVGCLMATIVFCSVFVALSAFAFVVIYFIFELFKNTRDLLRLCFLGIVMVLTFVVCYTPYYVFILSRSSNLIHFWFDNHNGFYQLALWLFFEWGILIVMFMMFLRYLFTTQKVLFTWCCSMVLATLLTYSSGFNDLGMRAVLPIEFAIVYLVFKIFNKRDFQYYLIVFILSGLLGNFGSIIEFKARWQKREVYTWSESQLVDKVRLLVPLHKLVGVYPSSDDRRWVELIPTFAGRTMISPDFVSSSVYYIPTFPSNEEKFMDLYRDIIYPERRIKYGNNFSLKLSYIDLLNYYLKFGAEYLVVPKMSSNTKTEQLMTILDSDKSLESVDIYNYKLYKTNDVLVSMKKWDGVVKDN